jgi:acetyltransferase-like isoleucine patch superfamily enzyme
MKTHINYFNSLLFKILPETRCFILKTVLLRLAGVKIGKNTRICSSVSFLGNGNIVIGDNVWIGPQVFLSASGEATINIGSHVGIAPQTYIATGSHDIDYDGISSLGKGFNADVNIAEGVWIGPKVLILPGVVIGVKAIVAAGSVVTKDVVEKTLVGGVPAKHLRYLLKKV